MIFGIDTISAIAAGTFLIKASAAACPDLGHGRVNVKLDVTDKPYITNLSSIQLTQQYGQDLLHDMSTNEKWQIGGLHRGNTSYEYTISFNGKRDPKTKNLCVGVNDVNVTIHYKPDIYIASDYLNMGCRYSATLMHEKRHYDTQIRTLRSYMPQFEKNIEAKVKMLGTSGPYAEDNIESVKDNIGKLVSNGIEQDWGLFEKELDAAQAKIDTTENYKRDSALCPGQFPKSQ